MSRLQNISDSEFIEAVQTSYYMVDVLEKLGYSRTSGTMTKYIKERIKELGIETSHFKGKRGNRGGGNTQRYQLSEILVENSTYTNRNRLKIRMLEAGILDNVCSECHLTGVWNGKPIVLHLDHINGVPNDNRVENLRLLCPNCHSQTDTYSGRNIART